MPLRAAFASLALLCLAAPASAHLADCSRVQGVEAARCDRHAKMALKCGMYKGEQHHLCDRSFLLANPLACESLKGADNARCLKENDAFKTCEPQAGRAFLQCVKKATGEDPRGH